MNPLNVNEKTGKEMAEALMAEANEKIPEEKRALAKAQFIAILGSIRAADDALGTAKRFGDAASVKLWECEKLIEGFLKDWGLEKGLEEYLVGAKRS